MGHLIAYFCCFADDEEIAAPAGHSYPVMNRTTAPTTTSSNYSSTNGSYQVTPPSDVPMHTLTTNYPTNTNTTHTTNRAYSPRQPPSFATLRATSAASIGQYNRNRLGTTGYSYNSPRHMDTSAGAEYAAQRHYRPPTPRSIDNRSTATNSSNYNTNYNYTTNASSAESRDTALYADLLGETVREGYPATTNPVPTTQHANNTTDRETDWSHVHSASYDSGPLSNHMATLSRAPVLSTKPNPTTTLSSAGIDNNRSQRPVKTVNWADLNDSSSSSNSSISDSDHHSDNDDADIDIHRIQSEEWEQVGDYHSASSISNSSTESTASAINHPTSVYDILQQAAAMSRDATTSTLTINTDTNNDSELSPWADPTYLDLHLLGDSTDEAAPYRMHDRGNIRGLLGINTITATTSDNSWSMTWTGANNNNGVGFDDVQPLQVTPACARILSLFVIKVCFHTYLIGD